MIIRPAHERDFENMWEIFHSVIQSGDTYVFAPDTPRQVAHEYFLGSDVKSWVADENVRDLLRTIFGASRSRRGHRELALDASFVSQRSTLVLAWNKFQKLWNRPSSCPLRTGSLLSLGKRILQPVASWVRRRRAPAKPARG